MKSTYTKKGRYKGRVIIAHALHVPCLEGKFGASVRREGREWQHLTVRESTLEEAYEMATLVIDEAERAALI